MSILYTDDGTLLWGHVHNVEHTEQLMTLALYWRGVYAEIEEHGSDEERGLLPLIQRVIDGCDIAVTALGEADERFDAMRGG